MQKTKEYRTAGVRTGGVQDMTLVGNPVVYETPTTISLEGGGSYTEIIHRGALDGCDLTDSTLIFNHDTSRVPLARTGRTMALTVTEEGLYMRAELAGDSPQAREVYSAVRRGDITGMSFAFVVPDGGSRYDAETNTRHITSIAKIYEISLTPWPAYPTASVEARDAIRARRDAAREEALSRAARIAAMCRASRIINHTI